MNAQEEYELRQLGFTEEEIKEMQKAEQAAKKDIKAAQIKENAKESRKHY
jgi:hypothetical protein